MTRHRSVTVTLGFRVSRVLSRWTANTHAVDEVPAQALPLSNVSVTVDSREKHVIGSLGLPVPAAALDSALATTPQASVSVLEDTLGLAVALSLCLQSVSAANMVNASSAISIPQPLVCVTKAGQGLTVTKSQHAQNSTFAVEWGSV